MHAVLAALSALPLLTPQEDVPRGEATAGARADVDARGWSRFRGPNGTGLAGPGDYPRAPGPEASVVWKRPFAPGFSSPVLTDRLVLLTGLEGEELCTYAVDRDTGADVWKGSVTRARVTRFDWLNHSAAASVAVDGRTAVAFFDELGLVAYDLDGKERWRLPLGPFDNFYGMGASPILVDGVVVQAVDQSSDSYVLGVDAETGDVVWRTERPQAVSGHSTPVVHRGEGGRAEVVLPGSFLLDAYDARTGERLWWVTVLPAEMKSVPVLLDGVLWIHGYASPINDRGRQVHLPPFAEALATSDADGSGGIEPAELEDERARHYFQFVDLDGDGSLDEPEWEVAAATFAAVNSALAVRVGGRGDVTEQVLWRVYRGVPQLPSPLVHDGVYWMLEDQGGLLSRLDARTGELLERQRLTDAIDAYYASPVAGGRYVYLLSETGILTVLENGAPVHTTRFDEACYATPALDDGRLWLRTASRLYCLGEARRD